MSDESLDFDGLYAVLDAWPAMSLPPSGSDGLFERVRQILAAAETDNLAKGLSDLAPLLRHLLRRQSLRASVSASFRVPTTAPWPSASVWATYGISAHSQSADRALIEARPWRPDWLNEADVPLFEDVFAERIVRKNWTNAIDPFLGETSGFTTYVTPGQREAVRSAFLVPPGETLLVCLPTGSGKSLVAQALCWPEGSKAA